MLSLIWKDYLIQKRSWLTVFIIPLFMLIAFSNDPSAAPVAGALAVAYLLIAGACVYDEKNKSHVLWSSLPISRKTIVGAKYLSALTFMVVGIAIAAVYGFILKIFNLPVSINEITIKNVIVLFIATTSFTALYLPVYFKFGYARSRYFSIIIYIFMFMAPQYLMGQLKSNPKLSAWLQNVGGSFLLALVASVMLAISYFVSVRIYQNKDII